MKSYDNLHYYPKKLPQPKSKFTVFIDRDGVIWDEKPPSVSFFDYPLIKRSAEAIKKLNEKGMLTVVVNNQARVARGEMTETEAKRSNQILKKRLKELGAKIDLYLFCPHSEFADVSKYLMKCNWRKPGSGMLEFVGKNLKVDLKKSFLVGDQARDFLAAKKTGTVSIGVKTGKKGKDEVFIGEPDFWKKDLFSAVEYILKTI